MNCPACHESVPNNYKFCPVCGGKLPVLDVERNSSTFKRLYDEWKIGAFPNYAPNTVYAYELAAQRMSGFNEVPIGAIAPEEIQRTLNNLTHDCAAPIRALCGKLCRLAIEKGELYYDWSKLLVVPKATAVRRQVFSRSEIDRLWQAYHDGHTDAGYVLILIYTGMRTCEFLDVKVEDIDFDEHVIANCGHKTEVGINSLIVFPSFIAPVIYTLAPSKPKAHLVSFPEHVFYHRYYTALEEAGVRLLKPYCCRYTCATMLARRNINVAIAQRVLRHKDVTTTLSIYTHVEPSEVHEYIDALAPDCEAKGMQAP